MAIKKTFIEKNIISDSEIMENIKSALNKTVKNIAEDLGVTPGSINEILYGRNKISKKMKDLLLWAYPISKNYIEFGFGDVLVNEDISTLIKKQEAIDKKLDSLLELLSSKK